MSTENDNYFVQTKKNKKGAVYFKFAELKNPVDEQLVDPSLVKKLYKNLPFIPYAGTTLHSADSFINLLFTLKDGSKSKGTCLNSIKEYSFGGKMEVVKSLNESFKLSNKQAELSLQEQENYILFLQGIIIEEADLLELASNLYDGFSITGDCYLKVVIAKVAGIFVPGIYVVDNRTVRYVNDGTGKMIAISQKWDYNYIRENEPEFIPVYPNYTETDNEIKFIIHKKNGKGFYGRPGSVSSLIDQYTEYKETVYRASLATNRFVPDVLIELEAPDPTIQKYEEDETKESGFDNIQDRLNYEYSNKSEDPASLMLIERGYKSGNAFIHEFNINTKEKYFKTSGDMCKESIFIAHNWSQRLAGVPLANGWSNEAFLDELRVKEITVKNTQNIIEQVLNKAFSVIARYMNPEMEKYSINFVHPYRDLLESGKENIKSNADNDLGNSK